MKNAHPTDQDSIGLGESEVKRIHETGYLGPFPAISEAEMGIIRDRLDREVLTTPGPDRVKSRAMRHLDQRVVYDLVTQPAIVGRIQHILGPNLLLWASTFWLKEPGGKEVPWHQDMNYWPIEPTINVTAWIAVDEVTEEANPDNVDSSAAVSLTLKPGQFVLFNERTLHYSDVNRSEKRRFAMGPRGHNGIQSTRRAAAEVNLDSLDKMILPHTICSLNVLILISDISKSISRLNLFISIEFVRFINFG